MLVYFIFSCNFHIAFVCNLLYGDICLSFVKKYYLQCALCKYNPGERPGNQFDKFQPNYSPQIPNNEKTNKQIPTTLLPFKFQTNKFQPNYSPQIPNKQIPTKILLSNSIQTNEFQPNDSPLMSLLPILSFPYLFVAYDSVFCLPYQFSSPPLVNLVNLANNHFSSKI